MAVVKGKAVKENPNEKNLKMQKAKVNFKLISHRCHQNEASQSHPGFPRCLLNLLT